MRSFSFEIFPPKRGENLDSVFSCIEDLALCKPDFLSVTFGASGSKNSTHTLDIASFIKSLGIRAIVHLPCIHQSKESIRIILQECERRGLMDILALRGDIVEKEAKSKDFSYASDLISFIKEQNPSFNTLAACYPEKHQEALSFAQDLKALKIKCDSGASLLVSQMFFDNEDFFKFMEFCEIAGIKTPVLAGLMPITNARVARKISSLCAAKVPQKFARILSRWEHNPQALFDAGVAYAIDQIVDLLSHKGLPENFAGIHIYTMNKSKLGKKIEEAVRILL